MLLTGQFCAPHSSGPNSLQTLEQAATHAGGILSHSYWPLCADSKMLLTACDDMHSHLYDVEHASLVEAFSGQPLMHSDNRSVQACLGRVVAVTGSVLPASQTVIAYI